MNRDVLILQVTQVSSGILRRLKVRRSIWDSEARTLGDHGTTPRPIDATVQDCAVHMIVDSLTLVFQVYCLGAVDALVTPPPLHRLVHGALGWTKTTNKEGTMLVYSVFVMYILSHVKN